MALLPVTLALRKWRQKDCQKFRANEFQAKLGCRVEPCLQTKVTNELLFYTVNIQNRKLFLKKKWSSLKQGDLNNSIANIFRKLGHVKIWTYIWVIRVCLYRILLMESSEHMVIENADCSVFLRFSIKPRPSLPPLLLWLLESILKKNLLIFYHLMVLYKHVWGFHHFPPLLPCFIPLPSTPETFIPQKRVPSYFHLVCRSPTEFKCGCLAAHG